MQVHEAAPDTVLDSVVIGAGQAGLAASYFLRQRGIDHLVLDANPGPGGAWQHRWASLSMGDVHGVADLPASTAPDGSDRAANLVVPDYFDGYERWHHLPVVRPVQVDRVESEAVDAGIGLAHAGVAGIDDGIEKVVDGDERAPALAELENVVGHARRAHAPRPDGQGPSHDRLALVVVTRQPHEEVDGVDVVAALDRHGP
jgi:hypothetical protein